jgi:Zn-dependent protease with chaperone function
VSDAAILPDRVVPEERPTDRAYRSLLADPRVLPSATTLRFAVLVLLLIATAGSAYGYIGLLVHPSAETGVARCLSGASIDGVPDTSLTHNAYLSCTGAYASSLAAWSAIGVGVIVVANLLVYAILPRWTRRRLTPLDPSNRRHRDIEATVVEYAREMDLDRAPEIWFDPLGSRPNGRVFGYQRRAYLRLNLGMMLAYAQDRPQFDAILRHELAHIRNRDIRPSTIALAAWRVFVVVVLLPFVVALVLPGLFASPDDGRGIRLRWTLPGPHVTLSLVGLSVLVFLTQRAVLRVRESHADAIAAVYDRDALARAIDLRVRSEAGTRSGFRRRAWFLADHPSAARRLDDLEHPVRLSAPDSFALFSAGVAISVITINTWFLMWVGGLVTWLTRGPLASVMIESVTGRIAPILAMQLLVDGPAVLVMLVIVARIGCVTAWRAQLCVPFGGRPLAAWRLALPLAIGMMLGEPTSVLYADAGFSGVFDTGTGHEVLTFALSLGALLIVLLVFVRWAADAATVWIPATVGSLRRACSIATAVACVGAFPAVFTWFLVHNNPTIHGLSISGAPGLPGWFGSRWVFTGYDPLNFIDALPGGALALGIPFVYVAIGAARRVRASEPRWLPAGLESAAPVLRAGRSRDETGFVVGVGVYAMVVAALVGFATMTMMHLHLGEAAIVADRTSGGFSMIMGWMMWTTYAAAALAAIVVVVRVRRAHLSWALLTVFVVATWATLVMPAPLYVAMCGTRAYACATAQPDIAEVFYAYFAAIAPVAAAFYCVSVIGLALLIRAVVGAFRRAGAAPEPPPPIVPDGPAAPRTGVRVVALTLLAITVLIAVADVSAYVAYVFRRG